MDGEGFGGRVVLVTGAGQGIGAAVARAFAGLGARLALLDRDGSTVAAVADGLPDAHAYPADVSCRSTVDGAMAAAERDIGPIDVCVNVAGVLRTGLVVDTSDADWAAVFAVNTTGVFHVSRAVANRMVARRRGVIVTVGSNAAGVPRAGMAAYAASKAAAAAFTRCLGLELAPHGIRCNVVAPGSTDTPMQRSLWPDRAGAAGGADRAGAAGGADRAGAAGVIAGDPAAFRVGIPLGRIAAAEDVADAVVFLASDRARHITMHDLYVDGGATLRA